MHPTHTWTSPSSNGQYSYYYAEQPQHHTPATTESSPISPQHFEQWLGSSPIEPPFAAGPFTEPIIMGSNVYVDEPEEIELEEEHEQEHDHDHEDVEFKGAKRERAPSDDEISEFGSPPKRRRRTGEDGERKIRSSRACTLCRKFKAKCMPGPSLREPDEYSPCMRCSTTGHQCVFTASLRGKYPTKKFARLQKQLERMERIHRLLEEAIQSRSQPRRYVPYLT